MGLFNNMNGGKKNSDNLKTLSENEIRNKLYGSLLTEDKEVQVHSSSPKNVPAGGASADVKSYISTEKGKDQSSESDLFSSAKESFAKTKVTEERSSDAAGRTNPVQIQLDQRTRLQKWLKEENKIIYETKVKGDAPKPKQSGPDWQNLSLKISKAAILFFQGVLSVTKVVVSACAGLYASMDFRRREARALLYGLLITALIVVIFSSIHTLNVKRENAMTHSLDKKVQTPVSADTAGTKKSPEKIAPVQEKTPTPPAPIMSSAAQAKPTMTKPDDTAPVVSDTLSSDSSVGSSDSLNSEGAQELSIEKPYTIQLATYVNPGDAKQMVEKLKAKDIFAFVVPLERTGGKIYHCVFVGRYKTFAEGEKFLEEYKKVDIFQPFQDAFVRSLKRNPA